MCLLEKSWTKQCRQVPKINKTAFALESFTADFSEIFSTAVKIWHLGDRVRTCHQFRSFQGFFSNLLIS